MGISLVSAGAGGAQGQEVGLEGIGGAGQGPAVVAVEGVGRNLLDHGRDQSLLLDRNLSLEGEGPPHLEDQIVTLEDQDHEAQV